MPPRIPTEPFDVESLIPELAGLGRETTLLYPRSGEPGMCASSIGGPLLWPADEPWPLCAEPGHWKPLRSPTEVVGPEPVAMVPVVQLYARDVPGIPFLPGTDVLQVVWCPLIHDDEAGTVLPKVYWRSEQAVAGGRVLPDPPVPYEYDEEFVPRPCTVTPTRVVEYPNGDLPDSLARTSDQWFAAIEEEFGLSYYEMATTVQSKAGGYPGWLQQPDWPDCRCGRRMDHLLSITATEPVEGRWFRSVGQGSKSPEPGRWATTGGHPGVDAVGHGMDMGDLGGVYLFVCPECPGMPYAHRYDC
ncbi:hypothetical protein [Streptomyces sp. NPDC092952]|uniref:hypothetical protein n=1 Tax=Streptomyces sp. NPDC092952 TaxID=3366018 RepID=UPI00381473D7